MKRRKEYVAPTLTVVKVKSEQGYSGSMLSALTFWDLSALTSGQVEDYQEHETWNDGSSFWL